MKFWLALLVLIEIGGAYDAPEVTEIPEAVGKLVLDDSLWTVNERDRSGLVGTHLNLSETNVIVAQLGENYDEGSNQTYEQYSWSAANSYDGNFSKIWLVKGDAGHIKYYEIKIMPMSGFIGEVNVQYIEKPCSGHAYRISPIAWGWAP